MRRNLIVFGVVAVLVAAGGYGGWKFRQSLATQACNACGRDLHAETRTAGLVDGKRRVFCCPACALTDHRQTGKPVTITELTDFNGRAKIAPGDAYLVEGSHLNLCHRKHSLLDEHKHPMPAVFDRCSPSLITFASHEAAQRFQREHGGRVLRFQEVAELFQR